MSIEQTSCPHCGAVILPGQAICEACGKDQGSSVVQNTPVKSKVLSEILFALLALGAALVIGVFVYVNVCLLGLFGGESIFLFAAYFCGPVVGFVFGVVALILAYTWRARKRSARAKSGTGITVVTIIDAIAVGIIAYAVLSPLYYFLMFGGYIDNDSVDALIMNWVAWSCVYSPLLAFFVMGIAYSLLKVKRTA